MRSSSSACIKALNIALDGILPENVSTYIDDLFIHSATPEEHHRHLDMVFDMLSKAGFTLKPNKSKFFQEEIKVLGHYVSEKGIRPCEEGLGIIENFLKPRCIRHLRSFLGSCNYFRRHVPNS
jgi:hypothetical protein